MRGAEALLHEARRGADHLFLFALGEDHALGRAAQPARTPAATRRRPGRGADAAARDRRPCRRSACARTPVSIAALATAGGHVRDQARIERHRDDVVGTVFRPARHRSAATSSGTSSRARLRQRARRGDLHLHVDGGGAHVERAAEDVGEAEHVVDLVRIVRAAGRHDGVVAHLGHFLGA